MSNDRVVREASGGDPDAMQAMMLRAQRTQDIQALHDWLMRWYDQGFPIELEFKASGSDRVVVLRRDDGGEGLVSVLDGRLEGSCSVLVPVVTQASPWFEGLAWAWVCGCLRHALPPSHELLGAVDVLKAHHVDKSEPRMLHPQRWVDVVMRHELGMITGSQRASWWALHALRLALSGRAPDHVVRALGHLGETARRWQVSHLLTLLVEGLASAAID